MTGRPLEVLLHHWPGVIQAAETKWSRGFALSIQRASKRPTWVPSDRQMNIMQQMVAALFAGPDSGDGEMIEGRKS